MSNSHTEEADRREREVHRLLAEGRTPSEVVAELSTTAGALARFMGRRGDRETARLFGRIATAALPKPPRLTDDELAARVAERRDRKRTQLLEDLEWIAGTDSWESIAHRLGYASAQALERTLSRYELKAWAARVQREATSPYAARHPERSHVRAA